MDMESRYAIDYHKIMFQPEKLAAWLRAQKSWNEVKKFYPVYVEISLAGVCNHRCRFCAFDYLGYEGGFANFKSLKRAIRDMAKGGVKSILFSGEGEPLLYPKAKEIIKYANSLGIDVALATNGAFLEEDVSKAILPFLSWLKVSIDAGTAKTHMKIHRPKTQDFNKILNNLKKAVEIRKTNNLKCTLGGQMLLLPDNYKEAGILAKKIKKIGFDYLIIKPYSHHKKSITREYQNIAYEKYFYPVRKPQSLGQSAPNCVLSNGVNLKDELNKINSDNFKVIFRENSMKKLKEKRPYKVCHAVPFFWAHFATNGDVYSCGN
ncbi:MAG TPA: radical SAM protein, partial [Candidatus Uhrbacteria bacterium]|nr:radical SAM protein [Candidatus Uhrbacteria bacterium]